jgi:quercetin dioxygenase-like cupin family protein
MVKNLAKLSLLVSVLLIAACSKSEPEAVSEQPTAEPPPTAEPSPETATEEGGSGDPTVLDPDHYMTEFENDAVRIVRIKYGAGEESVMHYHPDSVAVFLTDIQAQMTLPDGSTADIAASAGEAVFNSAGEHLPKNSSDSAWEVVEVELKPRDSAGAASDGPDATVVDADHYTTEFENESVRIVRIAYGAGEASVMHYHPDSVAVFVTNHLVQMTMPDGSIEEIAAAAGDAIFIPGGQHLPKNVANSGWELVLIELK